MDKKQRSWRDEVDLDSMVGDILAEREPLRPEVVDPQRTALVIIDMQYLDASREHGLGRLAVERGVFDLLRYRFERIDYIVPRIRRLAEVCRSVGVQVIHVKVAAGLPDGRDASFRLRGVRCVEGSREADILDELAPQPGDLVIPKTTASAFPSTNLEWVLKNLGIDTVIGAGIVTSGCVEHTMREAGDRGYLGIVVEDACGGNSAELHEAALRRMSHGPLTVKGSDEVIVDLKRLSSQGKVLTPTG